MALKDTKTLRECHKKNALWNYKEQNRTRKNRRCVIKLEKSQNVKIK